MNTFLPDSFFDPQRQAAEATKAKDDYNAVMSKAEADKAAYWAEQVALAEHYRRVAAGQPSTWPPTPKVETPAPTPPTAPPPYVAPPSPAPAGDIRQQQHYSQIADLEKQLFEASSVGNIAAIIAVSKEIEEAKRGN